MSKLTDFLTDEHEARQCGGEEPYIAAAAEVLAEACALEARVAELERRERAGWDALREVRRAVAAWDDADRAKENSISREKLAEIDSRRQMSLVGGVSLGDEDAFIEGLRARKALAEVYARRPTLHAVLAEIDARLKEAPAGQ